MISLAGLWAARKTDQGIKQIRLWTSYFLIFLVVVFGSLSITNYVKQVRMERANHAALLAMEKQQTAITLLQSVNAQQDATIERINTIRATDGEVLTGLQDDLSNLRKRDGSLDEKLKKLERNYAEVRDFMQRPVPVIPGGGCMLDNSCKAPDPDQSGDADDSEVPAPKVSPAAAGRGKGSTGLHHQQQCPTIGFRWMRSANAVCHRLV